MLEVYKTGTLVFNKPVHQLTKEEQKAFMKASVNVDDWNNRRNIIKQWLSDEEVYERIDKVDGSTKKSLISQTIFGHKTFHEAMREKKILLAKLADEEDLNLI
jgi:hypothetical protein